MRHGEDPTVTSAISSPVTECLNNPQAILTNGDFSSSKPRLLLLITEDWYFRSHRLILAREAQKAGMEVFVATLAEDNGKWISDEGFTYLPIPFVKGVCNPLRELVAVLKLTQLYRRVRPDIVHHVAIKPILYGSLAARFAGLKAIVNAFGGLGFAFSSGNGRASLRLGVKAGLRLALSRIECRVVTQNRIDRDQLIEQGIVRQSQATIIPGVGVDTENFTPSAEGVDVPIVVLASRMVFDKGVREFVEAAQLLKAQGMAVRCVLVGRIDERSPTNVPEEQLCEWQTQGIVEWWGHRDDMPQVLSSAQVVVLPSYYEGFPKVLLEACACGRPVVATNVSGCAEIVRDGENGFLIPIKDPTALANAIKELLQNPSLRDRMGKRGREIAVREFSAEGMARETIKVYRELLEQKRSVPA